jgi:hypothetical protein
MRAQEGAQKARVRGLEAQKQNIMAAKAVAKTLRSSLGPKARSRTAVGAASACGCAALTLLPPHPLRAWTRCCRAATAT